MPLPYFQRKIISGNAKDLDTEALIAALLFDGDKSAKTALQQAACILQSSHWSTDIDLDILNKIIESCGLTLSIAQKIRLIAALEFGKRLNLPVPTNSQTINQAEDVVLLVQDMIDLKQEHIRVILLDNQRCVVAMHTLYIGTVDTLVFRTSELFREAVTRNAPALIIVHNHPSGNPAPTDEDILLTNQVKEAGKLLDIQLLDHIIVSRNGWVSLLTH